MSICRMCGASHFSFEPCPSDEEKAARIMVEAMDRSNSAKKQLENLRRVALEVAAELKEAAASRELAYCVNWIEDLAARLRDAAEPAGEGGE